MDWLHYLWCFLGGAFLTNGVPHFVHGVSGKPFQTPFAKPPGKGLSSSTVNVLWGSFNFAAAYLLIGHAGRFDPYSAAAVVATGLGMAVMAVLAARMFGELHGGEAPAHDRSGEP